MGLLEGAQGHGTPMLLPVGIVVNVPTCLLQFSEWNGDPIPGTYGGKAVLELNGEPLFAELAVLRLLEQDGWDGVWVDSYRRRYMRGLPGLVAPSELPEQWQSLFARIAGGKSSWSGRWDVVAWQGSRVLFVEAKRRGRDRIQASQLKWLEAALAQVPLSSFLLVDWHLSIRG
jgi:hypothetical protein